MFHVEPRVRLPGDARTWPDLGRARVGVLGRTGPAPTLPMLERILVRISVATRGMPTFHVKRMLSFASEDGST